jgi:hypothetical protein
MDLSIPPCQLLLYIFWGCYEMHRSLLLLQLPGELNHGSLCRDLYIGNVWSLSVFKSSISIGIPTSLFMCVHIYFLNVSVYVTKNYNDLI